MAANKKIRSRIARVVVLAFLAAILPIVAGTSPVGAEPFVSKWGTRGSGVGQFQYPQGVAADANNKIYVADTENHRILKFRADGTPIAGWGGRGNGNGQFNYPYGVAVDAEGNVFVADTSNSRIQKFTATGDYLTQWGSSGGGNGQFNAPRGVAVDSDGNVYVADTMNNRVQKFTTNGGYLTQFANGQVMAPEALAVDADGYVYVTDTNAHRVWKYTSDGLYPIHWGGFGVDNGELYYPRGVTVDGDGNVLVVDTSNNRVQKFNSSGGYLTQWGTYGSANGQFYNPRGVAVDGQGYIYVVDSGNTRVQKFGVDPTRRPDGRIKKGATGRYVGNNVYNTTGVDQTKRGSAARGASVTYYVLLQNDALVTDRFRLKGAATNAEFRVTYTNEFGFDVTPDVTDGAYLTPVLAPGATFLVKVVVTVRSAAPVGSSLNGSLVIKSNTDLTRRDTVRFITSRA